MIKAEHVSYTYDEEETEEKNIVVDDVSLSIQEGEFLAILGHNGSGKSTFAKMLNAVLLPAGGTVYVDQMDTKDESLLYEIRRKVGMVFQNPDNQLVATIVEEDVAFGPENLGLPSEEIRKRVDEALRIVDMTAYQEHAPHMLSGGQKQRIAIAGIFAMKPNYIIFDESTAMLDPTGRKEVMNTIRKLNKEFGITIVLITHYMEEAAMADRVVVLKNGKMILEGTPRQVFENVEQMKALKLGVPQPTELAYELNKLGVEIRQDVLTAEEFMAALQTIKKKLMNGEEF